MDSEHVNPYAAPSLPADATRPTETVDLNWVGVGAVLLVTLAFVGFTVLLLVSRSSMDRQAGLMFLVNWPVLGYWLFATYRQRTSKYRMALYAVLVQIGISVAMLKLFSKGIELEAVVGIDGGFAIGFLAAHGVLMWLRRRARLLENIA